MLRHVMEIVLDMLLPKTDLGVMIQVVVITMILGLSLFRFWSRTELRLVVMGLGLLAFGLIGLRALH